MKKNILFIALIGVLSLFVSCATTLNFNKTTSISVPNDFSKNQEPNLEFIGFKADANNLSTGNGESVKVTGTWTTETNYFPSDFDLFKTYKTDTSLKNLGNLLEKSNVAYDKSFSYFGIYSLQELELYKGNKRFVTFVEVNKNHLGGTIKDSWLWRGALLTGAGLGSMIPGVIWTVADSDNELGLGNTGKTCLGIGIGSGVLGGILLAMPAKTTLRFSGEYQIYVYDTRDKKIVYKESVVVSETDTFSGSFFNETTNKYEVYNYYGTIVNNAILKKYAEVEKYIETFVK